ncbi:MAG TPA: hypothetical protein IAC97_00025 [Candidatus Pelethousia gallinarum]|nr:hypothetical protein [Candidatus Pelethousia gallinarum]
MSRNRYTVARKSIWYVLRTMLAIVAVVIIALYAFIGAMHVSNIYILVSEGMELRASCILKGTSINELTEYFTEDFIASDSALYDGKYADYTITNFIYRQDPTGLFVLPWDVTASMEVTESMLSLSGTPNENAASSTIPPWTPTRYSVKLRQIDGRWYICDLVVLEENPQQEANPTPDMSLLPSPTP